MKSALFGYDIPARHFGRAVQVDVRLTLGLKALGFQLLESTSLSKLWFQLPTCTALPRGGPRSLTQRRPGRRRLPRATGLSRRAPGVLLGDGVAALLRRDAAELRGKGTLYIYSLVRVHYTYTVL